MTDNSLIFLSKSGSEIEPVKKEAFRYMNCKADYKDEELEKLYEECLRGDEMFWKESCGKPRQLIKKQRHHFAHKGPYSQSYGFFK